MKFKFILWGLLSISLFACGQEQVNTIKDVFKYSVKLDTIEFVLFTDIQTAKESYGKVPEGFQNAYMLYLITMDDYAKVRDTATSLITEEQINSSNNNSDYKNLLKKAETYIKYADLKHEHTKKVIKLMANYVDNPDDIENMLLLAREIDEINLFINNYNDSKRDLYYAF